MPQAKPNPSKDKRARILLVDDHAVLRYGIAQLIDKQKDLIVCGEADSVSEAMAAIPVLKPDLLIVDISLKESNGLELIKNIHVLYPRLPQLVVSMHEETLYAELALRAGALGYLMKAEAIEKVLSAIHRVLSGKVYVSERMAAEMLQQHRDQPHVKLAPLKRLTDRERQVFQLIGEWKGTRQIADELCLSVKTIEYYRERIKAKLNLKTGSDLVRYATDFAKRKQSDTDFAKRKQSE